LKKKGTLPAIGLFLTLFCISQAAYSQDQRIIEKKHELGIDITNTLTFLKKNNQSYLLNYRHYFNRYKYALRLGLNFDLSSGDSEGYYPDVKVGVQKNKFENRWNTYYGLDGSFAYFKSNSTPISTTRVGLTPFFGVGYFFNKKISLSTEIGVNFNQFFIKSKNSFDPQNNTSYTRINIGYVGMFLVSYHF
jgi:hypothetical protein